LGSDKSDNEKNSTTAKPSDQSINKPQITVGGDVHGDISGGDAIGGDKVGGDKISGDVVITGQVSGDLQVTYMQRAPIPAPPPPLRPPHSDLFIGREKELATYSAALDQAGIAVISGMAGMGKTTLAAELARRVAKPELTFWHSFHDGEGIEGLIWRLAGFLASNGQEDLWSLLQNALLNHNRPKVPGTYRKHLGKELFSLEFETSYSLKTCQVFYDLLPLSNLGWLVGRR
jgi:hypothetical protein